MIDLVDALLERVLRGELNQAFAPTEVPEIVYGHPSTIAPDAPPTVSIHLYDVRENVALRVDPFTVGRKPEGKAVTRVRSTMRFDLTYAVSGHAGDPRAEHALLTYVLGSFLRNPIVEMVVRGPEGDEAKETVVLAVAQPDHEPPPPDPRAKPSVTLRVTAPFNPFDVRRVPLVREAVFGYGPGTEPGFLGHPVDVHATRLSAAGTVTHRAPDGEVRPLANVLVSVVDGLARTTTDEAGGFLLVNLPPGRHEIRFDRRGYAPVPRSIDAPAAGRGHELRATDVEMRPLGHEEAIEAARGFTEILQTDQARRTSVVGRLRYPDGSPAAFLPVRMGERSTVTDSQGVYALSQIPPDAPLEAEIPGFGLRDVRDATPAPPKVEKEDGTAPRPEWRRGLDAY